MEIALAGAHSVFGFIERTAQSVPNGVRWETIDYDNHPHYHYEIFNGCGGISLFLAEYARLTGSESALDLAVGANQWCSSKEHEGYTRGLHLGKTGVAMSWLHLSQVTRETGYLSHCTENAEILLREDPGPFTDILGGAASNGLFLIRLWQATGDQKYLDGAVRCGAWLRESLVRDDRGCHCLARPDGRFGELPFLGVAHGISGVAHYFLLLYEFTRDRDWEACARELLDTVTAHAIPDKGGLNWAPLLGHTELSRCQWSHGAAGIGLVFAKAFELLGDRAYLEIAVKCGKTTYAYGDFRNNATQCIGVSGCGELFLELFRIGHEEIWLARALEFAQMAMGYRDELPQGDAWPTDEPGLYSADFMYGAAGIGHYFLRLHTRGEIAMPLM
jgi:lantibiotic modifying enzyme